MKTTDLIAEAVSLPVEQRARVIDSLLKSLNPHEAGIDKNWALVADRRLAGLRTSRVKVVPGNEVFQKIRHRFSA